MHFISVIDDFSVAVDRQDRIIITRVAAGHEFFAHGTRQQNLIVTDHIGNTRERLWCR